MIADLLSQAGISQANLKVERCPKGGNNRTYRVETTDGVFAAKQYFRHPSDSRDRLGAEFSFLTYAAKVAQGIVPKAYAQNRATNMALYEFIEGQPLTEVTPDDVDQAIEFFCKLNKSRRDALFLGNASEACFSLQEHYDLIALRLKKLEQIEPVSEEAQIARHYAKKLKEFWTDFQLVEIAPLTWQQRCLSPSDFGFHNALRREDGRLCFLDFEYAGWDDPAKMAGDFFAQIAVPVPDSYFEAFIHQTMALFPGREELIHRAKLLRPAYQVKWCCIALNVFLPDHLERRKFADENLDVRELQRAQLEKVQKLDLYGIC